MVDKRGSLSFAGSAYHVGSRYAAQQVEVRLVGATVEISQRGKLIRTYAAKHDRSKEHGAFATPGGRPHKKESDRNDQRPDRNRGAEAKL
jgi:hypothetical protein